MLNEESRKYFNRAFALSSTSFNFYTLFEPNHLKRLQECSEIDDKKMLIEYLQTADSDILAKCASTNDLGKLLLAAPWVPTIENASTKGAFITKTPEEIYNSDKAPVLDTMFTFTSDVFQRTHFSFNININSNFFLVKGVHNIQS